MKSVALSLLVMLGFIALGYFASQHVKDDKEKVNLGTEVNCDPLKTMCEVEDKGIGITFHLPAKVQYLKPFQIKVIPVGIKLLDIEKVVVTFEMTDMDMGQNQFVLKAQQAGVYTGVAVLPVCVTGRVDWDATVNIITEPRVYLGRFKFSVLKQP